MKMQNERNLHSNECVKAVLVNPWIYDFAAYNFWIRPIGLYHVAEWLWERGVELELVDCLSPFEAPGKFMRERVEPPSTLKGIKRQFSRYGIGEEEYVMRLKAAHPFDVAFVTSLMSYWYPGVKRAVEIIKSLYPHVTVVLGGVYATLWKDHALQEIEADLVLDGPIESHSRDISRLTGIPEIPTRQRRPWYLLGLHDGVDFSAIQTATGCPFKCTYCGSRRISGEYRPKSIDYTMKELAWLHHSGVRQVAFYDDALLVDFEHRLRPILEMVLSEGFAFTFHTPNGLHARYVTREVAYYFKKCGFKTIRLSLESASRERQRATGGKVTNQAVIEAVENLLEAGIRREDIGIYLLCGLPDQEAQEITDSIEFVKALGVRPYLAEFSPIPGTPEWERLVASHMMPRDIDPVLTNNTVFFRLYSRIGEEEWKWLQALRNQA